MQYLQLFLNDIFLSPIVYHFAAFVISTIKVLWVRHFLGHIYESKYWGSSIMWLMFFNPFLAFAADSFWVVWLQTLILSIPLAYLVSFYRQFILRVGYYRGSDLEVPVAASLGIFGQIASVVVVLVIYICKSIFNWIW